MQRHSALNIVHIDEKITDLEKKAEKTDLRIGIYYSKLKTNQKQRFERITRAISHRFKVFLRKNPVEIILIRQIALNTIRIEEAELALMDNEKEKYSSKIEQWLFLAQKERRDAITTLYAILERDKKKKGMNKFGELRDILREEENLPKSEIKMSPDGHDRRHYDDITRTTK